MGAKEDLSSGGEGGVVSLVSGGVVRVTSGPDVVPEIFPNGVGGPTVPEPIIDEAPRGSRTRLGVRRTNTADWRSLRNLWDEMDYGDILSPEKSRTHSKGTASDR